MGMFDNFWTGGNGWRRRHGDPRNRRELFLCVLTDQLFSLVFLNFFYGIFFLPAVLWAITVLAQIMNLFAAGETDTAIRTVTMLCIGLIPLITLTGPARAGMARVMRDWSVEETVPPLRTFWAALRKNWKQALAPSFITSIFPLVLWNGFRLSTTSEVQVVFSVLFALCSIMAVVWLLAQQIVYPLIVTYDLPLKGHLRNALLLTIMNLPRTLLIFMGSLFFIWIYVGFTLIRPVMYVSLIIIPILYYFFIGWCLTDLINASYSHYLFDKYFSESK